MKVRLIDKGIIEDSRDGAVMEMDGVAAIGFSNLVFHFSRARTELEGV
jgi:hypothetical protein